MSNMSYCRFQNTLMDLRDCMFALEDDEEMNDLSQDENSARDELIEICCQIAENYGDQ